MRWLVWAGVAACTPSIDVHRPEDAPTGAILTPVDGAVVPEGRLVARGLVSDAQDRPDHLFVVWSLRRDAGWEQACDDFALDDGSTQCTVDVGAEHTAIGLRVTDLAGFVGEVEAALTVERAAPPEVTLESPAPPGPFYADVGVELSAVVVDADDRPEDVEISVTSSLDGALPAPPRPDAGGRVRATLTLRAGVHTVEVTAVDPGGSVGRASVIVDVGPANAPPACRWDAPLDGAAWAPGPSVDVRASALDEVEPPDALSAVIRVDDGPPVWAGSPGADGWIAAQLDPLALGDHSLRLDVVDPAGASASCGVTVHVDTPPDLRVDQPAPDAVVAGPLRVELTVTDERSAAEALLVTLASDVDGPLWSLAPDADGRIVVETALSPGTHTLTWRARDGLGLESAAVRRVTAEP